MAKKQTVEVEGFVNPFETGVNYKMFTDAIPEGVSIEEYCKDKLADEQIAFLVEDLKHYKK